MSDPERLTDLPLRRLTEAVASRAPVPGGGSVSALAGAMGAALVAMVVELSRDHPSLAAHREELGNIGRDAARCQAELLDLAERDAAAYEAVVGARRLPRGSEDERRERAQQIVAATREATRVPLRTAEVADEVLALAAAVAPLGNPNAISDAGVAAHLAFAAVQGALLNVRINIPGLPQDDSLRGKALGGLATLLPGAHERQRLALASVNERLEPVPAR